jgi:3-hydroxyanthranilate 3,4-dioxygenase
VTDPLEIMTTGGVLQLPLRDLLQGLLLDTRRALDRHEQPEASVTIWREAQLTVLVIVGPHANDAFHIDPSAEFFYQIQGDLTLETIGTDGRRQTRTVREGEATLVPANVPHSPHRPEGTVGLVVERTRTAIEQEGWAWFCRHCDAPLASVFANDGQGAGDVQSATRWWLAQPARQLCPRCGAVWRVPKTGRTAD